MNSKELKRLRRSDLLEILLKLRKENNQLKQELEQLREELQNKQLAVQEAGSLAEAAVKISGVFEAAQAACDQYTLNIQRRVAEQEELCLKMEQSTKIKCDQMLIEAAAKAESIRNASKTSFDYERIQ